MTPDRPRPVDRTDLAIALGLAIVALLLRLPGLGRFGLTSDEYYFLQSILFILDDGVPGFPGGGYYVRGILLQYLSAIPVAMAGGAGASTATGLEGAARVLPAILGSATCGLSYLLGRRFLDRMGSIATALILVLSSWQVEFSRFARMYAGFQLAFVGFVMALHAGHWQLGLRTPALDPVTRASRRRARRAAAVLAVVSVFVHAGAIFLPPLMVTAGLSAERLTRRSLSWLVGIPAAVLALCVGIDGLDLRNLGIPDALPPGVLPYDAGPPVHLPDVRLGSLALAPGFTLGLAVAGTLGVRAYRRTVREGDDRPATHALSALLLLAPLVHQIGLLLGGWVILAAASPPAARAVRRRWRDWAPALLVAVVTWLMVLALAARSDAPEAGRVALLRDAVIRLLDNVPLLATIGVPFLRQVPHFAALVAIAIGLGGLRAISGPRSDRDRFPILVVTASLLMLGFIRVQQDTTRYAYFLLPMFALLIGIELGRPAAALARRGAPALVTGALAVLPLGAMALTEELDPRHLARVATPEANYRTGEFHSRARHWYPRADFAGPAREASRLAAGDDVLVIEPPASRLYVDRPYLPYVGDDRPRFRTMARDEGTREIWTDLPLLHTPAMLFAAVPPAGEGSLWFVASVNDLAGSFTDGPDLGALAASLGLEAELVFTGWDGRVGVWRIRRTPRPAGSGNGRRPPSGSRSRPTRARPPAPRARRTR